ncbi:ROK family transcriptional regulator [Sphingobacterium yanglingense]|uniref:Putative NBD/HSP70 family sugar kinase n=1 Tax=Sphingobacterium yanglingense TaxID=1437280 RepID=A0A4R6WFE2_9SPHI|nr:ROK family transcriptional regulator [Sphingobacterium yanglingense]TDQ76727.1 putative NBD/HSP70 family sugar kinase [Sphingobacterium yanglingense]
MKTLNQAILSALYYQTPQSIAELSNAIGKSVPNVTRSIQELLKDNLISSEGLAPSTGGRRAIHYSLNIEILPIVLAIAIDQYNMSISLIDLSNRTIKEQKHINLHQNEGSLQRIIASIDSFLENENKSNILAIGISMPGFVDSEKGINFSYAVTDPLYNIKDAIERHLHIPTYIENDSTVIAIAEHQFGKAKGSNNALVINLNWGVGLGMILEGSLFKGHSGYAGEFSHIPLSNQNKLCSCGKRGCLEVEASLIAALGYASEQIENGQISQLTANYGQEGRISVDQLIAAALNGDQVAIESFAKIGYMLGKGIATLIHIINPEKVIISGKGSEIGQILLPQIQASMLEFSIQRLSKDTSIEISTLHNAQIIGTASIAVSSSNWEILHKKQTETN